MEVSAWTKKIYLRSLREPESLFLKSFNSLSFCYVGADWGWIVCSVAFLAHILTTGFQLSYGFLLLYAIKHLGEDVAMETSELNFPLELYSHNTKVLQSNEILMLPHHVKWWLSREECLNHLSNPRRKIFGRIFSICFKAENLWLKAQLLVTIWGRTQNVSQCNALLVSS